MDDHHPALADPRRDLPHEHGHLAHRAHGRRPRRPGRGPLRPAVQRGVVLGLRLHDGRRRAGHEPDLPLALGYGSTRRDFYLGSALSFVLLSVMWTVGLTVLSAVEDATDGWGIGGRMFTARLLGGEDGALWERSVIFLCGMLFFFFVGAAVAAVYVRWKATGLVAFFIGLGLLGVGAIALVTFTETWDAVGAFFVNAGALGVALWLPHGRRGPGRLPGAAPRDPALTRRT